MAYEKCTPEQRAQLLKMDSEAESAQAKLRADIMTDANIKPGVLYILRWAKAWKNAIGYKRIGEILVALAQEFV